MKKVIFVCLVNICRSPMAEMMMKDLVKKAGLEKQFQIESRSTSTYEIGNGPHPGALAELKRQDVPIIKHQAKQITQDDFDSADLIIGMDQQNIVNLKKMAPNKDQEKIHLAFEILNQNKEVEDPWYDHKFNRTYQQLKKLLPLWLKKISEK
ncbi:low molecular weight protein-tyrosine-phosphatase [Companilactobacillus halodurans]|uniref:protein-tyrosine-phosphatase n=1 Tax=Companilactobacillus halodurans TaxID=2584183 RepID=A0A5P0ZW44_9LACO|nr:low molecular weight protein-tyrosine-phosphatase [Companilactobacillus halodurans]MQS97239.1 low molecular weight phosphotyrosine protein phosphatase [Companilactobacillus halodurans]